MQPYYEQDGITIYCADALDIASSLQTGCADLIVTDPPYGVSWQSSLRLVRFEPIIGDGGAVPIQEWVRPFIPALRPFRHLYVFGLEDWGDLNIGGRCDLVWDKGQLGPGDLSLPWGPSHERIAFGMHVPSKGNRDRGDGRLSARLRRGSVLRYPRLNASAVKRHPTEKPVALLRELIESSSCLGELVLDPYAGSGATLEAARLEGRRAIGIEIDERYCEIAAKRLQQSVMMLEGVA